MSTTNKSYSEYEKEYAFCRIYNDLFAFGSHKNITIRRVTKDAVEDIAILEKHDKFISALNMTSNQTLVYGSYDRTVKVWYLSQLKA
jgi:WD40 repeat protein